MHLISDNLTIKITMKNTSLLSEKKHQPLGLLPCLLVFMTLTLPLWIAGSLLSDTFASWLIWIISGWLSWTFTEYSVHRFYMHHPQPNTEKKLYQSHMNHHRNPSHIKITLWHRLGMLISGLILLYFSFFLPPIIVIFTGFFIGFIGYTLMHWMLHQSWASRLFPRLQESHLHHHGRYPDNCFGFSLILWDHLFGTLAPKPTSISPKFREFYFKKTYPGKVNKSGKEPS